MCSFECLGFNSLSEPHAGLATAPNSPAFGFLVFFSEKIAINSPGLGDFDPPKRGLASSLPCSSSIASNALILLTRSHTQPLLAFQEEDGLGLPNRVSLLLSHVTPDSTTHAGI